MGVISRLVFDSKLQSSVKSTYLSPSVFEAANLTVFVGTTTFFPFPRSHNFSKRSNEITQLLEK